MTDTSVGYFIDRSHPPLVFVALQGLGEVLEHNLMRLEKAGVDVSTVITVNRHRIVVLTEDAPEPVTVQVVQNGGRLERVTEILGAGIGMGVLREVRRVAAVLEIDPTLQSPWFKNRIEGEKARHIHTYSLLKGSASRKRAGFAAVLRRSQEELCRGSGLHEGQSLKHAPPSFPFRRSLPKAIRELELAVDDILSGCWKRPVMEHVAEIASALSEACRAEGLREAAGFARSISSLVSASPDQLRSVEPAFRNKLVGLLYSLKSKAIEALGESASSGTH